MVLAKILPIKLLMEMQRRVLIANNAKLEQEKDKKKRKELFLCSVLFESNIHYLEKYSKKENLDINEIEVSEEFIKELMGVDKI